MPQSTNATLPKYKKIGYVSYKYDEEENGFDLTNKKIKFANEYYDYIPDGQSEIDANNYLPFLLADESAEVIDLIQDKPPKFIIID